MALELYEAEIREAADKVYEELRSILKQDAWYEALSQRASDFSAACQRRGATAAQAAAAANKLINTVIDKRLQEEDDASA